MIMRNKQLGERLLKFRLSLNLTSTELSIKLGASSGQWSSYEQGRTEPHLQTFLRLRESIKQHGIEFSESLFFPQLQKDHQVNSVAYTLQGLRGQLNLSRLQMAQELGLNDHTYARYERGETDLLITTFCKIRKYGRERGIELLFPPSETKEMKTNNQELGFHQTPSLRVCLQRG